MPTSTPFAYNTGATIAGTSQVGSLAVGTPTAGFAATGLKWWMGPDEDLGYVIAVPVPENTQPTPVSGETAQVAFYRSNGKTDQLFIDLVNRIIKTTRFTTVLAASNYIANLGYWTSYPYSTYTAGLYTSVYSGYFSDNASAALWSGTPTQTSVTTTNIAILGSGNSWSQQWLGYFKPTVTDSYTFTTNSDDASYMWLGDIAISGYTGGAGGNATVKYPGTHTPAGDRTSPPQSLTAGVYYPIRIQFGNAGGGAALAFRWYNTTTQTSSTNLFTGQIFYDTLTNGF